MRGSDRAPAGATRPVSAIAAHRATAFWRRLGPALIAATAAASGLAVPSGTASARPLPGDDNRAPTHPAPNTCRVDVRSDALPATLDVAHHLFIIYHEQGRELYFRGGPSRHTAGPSSSSSGSSGSSLRKGPVQPPQEPPQKIVTMHGQYKPGSPDYDPGAPSVTVLKGWAACGKDVCFAAEARRINNLHHDYHSLGPNSNTVAHTILAKCDVPANRPGGWAPGFDEVL